MSAALSERPIGTGPGIAKSYPPVAIASAVPAALKAEAIRLLPLTGMSMRECWRVYEGGSRGWTTIQRYFDKDYPKSCPPYRFVQWLKIRSEMFEKSVDARKFEVAR